MFDESKLFNLARTTKKYGRKRQFSAIAGVPLPFIHSSPLHLFKATGMPNFSAITLF